MSTIQVGGPMFEPKESRFWKSVHGQDGAHYNVYGLRQQHGMGALRTWFPDGEADELNFVLFSTSGVHGSYATIEDEEHPDPDQELDDDGKPYPAMVTFLIVSPRIVCMRYGNCEPTTPEDFAYLKKLRASSWAAVQGIGAPDKDDVGLSKSETPTDSTRAHVAMKEALEEAEQVLDQYADLKDDSEGGSHPNAAARALQTVRNALKGADS